MNRILSALSILLLISSCSNEDVNRINEASTKLDMFGLHAESLLAFNSSILTSEDSLKKYSFFVSAIDSLAVLRDELISATGGYTRMGQYFDPPAYNHVESYFYGETYFRNNSHKFFFRIVDRFIETLNRHPGQTYQQDFEKRFDILLEHYELGSRENLFRNLSINEAVELIEKIRSEIAFEQTKMILKKKKSG